MTCTNHEATEALAEMRRERDDACTLLAAREVILAQRTAECGRSARERDEAEAKAEVAQAMYLEECQTHRATMEIAKSFHADRDRVQYHLERTVTERDEARAELRELVEQLSADGFHHATTAAYSRAAAKLAEWERDESETP